MTLEPPSPPLDLLVVGGLTVDRFADGTAAPGGSVLHAALAARDAGWQVGVVSVAGPEPEAAAGVEELARQPFAAIARADRSVVFGHDEVGGRRSLTLVYRGAPIAALPKVATRAVLYAPVAGEVGASLLAQRPADAIAAAVLQGWLRTLAPGAPVAPIPAGALPSDLVAALSRYDLLVASREDLAADGDEPAAQLDALREVLGAGPALVVTDGAAGAWLDLGERWHEPAPRVVEGGTVGAGDMLAALLAVAWPRPAEADLVRRQMADAMRWVADRLATGR